MQELSDVALWSVAGSTMSVANRAELVQLNGAAGERPLSPSEADRQRVLLNEYNEAILRRAHAALLLKARGYDISDPKIFRPA
jgi:hypothetical protein